MIAAIATAVLLALSTPADEIGVTVSADGDEAFYAVRTPATVGRTLEVILHVRRQGAGWSEPEVAPFSGTFRDLAPAFAPDGQKLYFTSGRNGSFDIWVVAREGAGWSAPVALPAPVNGPAQEYGASVAADGTLYFASSRPGGTGELDIYRSHPVPGPVPGGWSEPELLGDAVNSAGSELFPAISPDGKTLVFTAEGRDDETIGVHAEYRKGDLYVSHLVGGAWTPARNAGAPVNSGAGESAPMFSADGKSLFFVSERGFATTRLVRPLTLRQIDTALAGTLNGMGNLYRVDAKTLP